MNDYAKGAASDPSGKIVVVGLVDYNAVTQVAVVVKYGPQGGQRWVRFYDDPAYLAEIASDVAVDATGNIYVLAAGWNIAAGRDMIGSSTPRGCCLGPLPGRAGGETSLPPPPPTSPATSPSVSAGVAPT
jgi:hypothetical protein